ncbi:MAG: 50S ribosomal protein L13 [Thermodesulfovibrionia bacterium]|nr:50S ribosomal protein L13 [Thermodesulfovibrionia bacterium]
MIIDAKGHVLGRLATYVAKNALLGEDIIIVNSEKIMISGKKKVILKREAERLETRNKGNPQKGPYHQKRPDKFVRRTIRGMLPWKRARGRDAFKRIMVYIGTPDDEIMRRHNINMGTIKIENLNELKKPVEGITVGEVCSFIGGKW